MPARSDSGKSPRRVDRQVATLFVVAVGGVVGAEGRYAVQRALPTTPGHFPWGTFWVNVSGSAVLGLLLVVLMERFPRGHLARPLLGTGVIGAYTTFSTFTGESVLLVHDGHPSIALAYVAASVAAGLAAVTLGMAAGRAGLRVNKSPRGEAR